MLLAAVGTVVGLLVAGVLEKLFPEHDLIVLQAAIVAGGCLIGVVLDGTDPKSKRPPRD
jgi:hypothetical protein